MDALACKKCRKRPVNAARSRRECSVCLDYRRATQAQRTKRLKARGCCPRCARPYYGTGYCAGCGAKIRAYAAGYQARNGRRLGAVPRRLPPDARWVNAGRCYLFRVGAVCFGQVKLPEPPALARDKGYAWTFFAPDVDPSRGVCKRLLYARRRVQRLYRLWVIKEYQA